MLYLWTTSMALGLPNIDEQHRELFSRADELLVAMRDSSDDGEIMRCFDRLGSCLEEHHVTEESCMLDYGYPGLAGHRVEHAEFAKAFGHVRALLDRDPSGPIALVAIQRNVCERMLDHIRQSDRSFGSFANSRGYRAAA